ncbi:hypothetical protein UFOVP139_51 [uncultured Caudovirales phage]|uniref:Bacteriophage lambda, GpH, tail tape measure, C-terminal n=1 Tax=uncultured Caudovirales phage TaxID=2100421 RepID=A0A6J5LGJ0_9CAUD|nr:hypothetical protein UFOVP139_51 [uncultured Caudovirales phage]
MAQAQEAELLYKIRVEASQAIKDMEAASGQLKSFNKEAANSATGAMNMGRGLQNASYQIQDFIVQTTNGTDALKAFAMQAPQLLGGFGAVGAVVGVIASLTPVVVEFFKSFNGGLKTFTEASKEAETAQKELKDSIVNVTSRKDLDPLIDAYKQADAQVRKLILTNIELNLVISQVAAKDLRNTLLNSIDEGIKQVGVFKGLWIELLDTVKNAYAFTGKNQSFIRDPSENLKSGFGITGDQLETIKQSQEAFKNAKMSATDFLSTVAKIYEATPKPTKDFTEWVQNIQKATKAQVELEKATKQYEDAQKRIASGDLSTVKGAEEAHKAWEKAMDKEIDQITKEFEAVEKLHEAHLKEGKALEAAANPQVAYNQALEKANVLLNDNAISAAGYEDAVKKASKTLANSNTLVNGFGDALTTAFTAATIGGKSFGEVMTGLAKDIEAAIMKIMIIEPMIQRLKLSMVQSGFFGGTDYNASTPGFIGPAAPVASANGNVFSGSISSGTSNVIPFATGGVVNSARYFPMAGGKTGLMGEAGAEAIMPLKRDSSGKLGVAASGGGGGSTQVNIYNETGGTVETKERKNPDGTSAIDVYIKKAVADGIAQGQFDKPMAASYGLRRQGSR